MTLPFSVLYLPWIQQIQRNDFDIGFENLIVLRELFRFPEKSDNEVSINKFDERSLL